MSVAQQSIAERITYDDLYRRWEEGNWKATELDFTQDKEGWETLSEIQRKSAMWVYSMFFYGEDAVADGLSPYIEAAPKEEQKYFLATQQVDEARHAVFFYRFFKEVIGVEGDIATGLEATLPELGWGYRNVFGRLEQMVDELHTDRSSSRPGRCRGSAPGWRRSRGMSSATSASESRSSRSCSPSRTSARPPPPSS